MTVTTGWLFGASYVVLWVIAAGALVLCIRVLQDVAAASHAAARLIERKVESVTAIELGSTLPAIELARPTDGHVGRWPAGGGSSISLVLRGGCGSCHKLLASLSENALAIDAGWRVGLIVEHDSALAVSVATAMPDRIEVWCDTSGHAAREWGVRSVPHVVITNDEGIVVHRGGARWREVRQMLEQGPEAYPMPVQRLRSGFRAG